MTALMSPREGKGLSSSSSVQRAWKTHSPFHLRVVLPQPLGLTCEVEPGVHLMTKEKQSSSLLYIIIGASAQGKIRKRDIVQPSTLHHGVESDFQKTDKAKAFLLPTLSPHFPCPLTGVAGQVAEPTQEENPRPPQRGGREPNPGRRDSKGERSKHKPCEGGRKRN